jgi:hypothetical protein
MVTVLYHPENQICLFGAMNLTIIVYFIDFYGVR